jgi:hypothetical protein
VDLEARRVFRQHGKGVAQEGARLGIERPVVLEV